VSPPRLERSRALWNRSALDLQSDEVLAQILDRGELDSWRAIYRLAAEDAILRARIARVVAQVPLGFPRFWLAALRALGESVDVGMPLPSDRSAG
jgi:hypothetical protein